MKINYSPILAAIAVMFSLAASAVNWSGTVDLSTITTDDLNLAYICQDNTTLTGTLSVRRTIRIGRDCTVTLDNVSIHPSGELYNDFAAPGLACISNATIILKGKNVVRNFHSGRPGIFVPKGGTLTIREAEGGGILEVINGSGSEAAGIGGGVTSAHRAGNIVIESGTITATGGTQGGAGIGGGARGGGCGTITIEGGKIIAKGGQGSAGIGAGTAGYVSGNIQQWAHCGNITITGGEIEATGGIAAAGIGGGYLSGVNGNVNLTGDPDTITIGYGVTKVTATRGDGFSASDTTLIEPIGTGYQSAYADKLTVDIDENLKELPSDDPSTRIIAMPATVNLGTVTYDKVIKDNSLVTGTLNGEHQISIADGATVILQNVHINSTGITNPRSLLAGLTCEGDATIILRGANTIRSFSCSYPGIFVPKNKTLTIMGSLDDSLEARCNVDEDGNGLAAGIGGGYNESCGNIVINGGTITAEGQYGSAGIGAGAFKKCGDITINGGWVTATGGNGAPGIGGAAGGKCGTITIGIGITRVAATPGEGGEVLGIQYPAASPIGAGAYSSCAGIAIDKDLNDVTLERTRYLTFSGINLSTIDGDSATADNEDNMVTGQIANNLQVRIDAGATVTLKDVTIDGENAKGIECLGDATIILKGKNVVQNNKRFRYPGIYVPNGSKLTITGVGELNVSSTEGAGIGIGTDGGTCGNISIEGGTIFAQGGRGSAGIGGGGNANCGTIDILGGNVTAIGDNGAAGIGCGASGDCGKIYIGPGIEQVVATAGDTDWNYEGTEVMYGPGTPIGLSGEPGSIYYRESTCPEPKVAEGFSDTTDEMTRTRTIKRTAIDLDGLGQGTTWKATSGMSLTGKTSRKIEVPTDSSVIINGVEVSGAVDAPVFDENEGKTETTEFVQSTDGTAWEITTFAELDNNSIGSDVNDNQIKIYSAENLEDLDSAEPLNTDVEIVEKKSAVMTKIRVTPPTPTPGAKSRFFKVKYGN